MSLFLAPTSSAAPGTVEKDEDYLAWKFVDLSTGPTDPFYISKYDHPKDSRSLLPGTELPKWTKGGKRLYPRTTKGKCISMRKKSVKQIAGERLENLSLFSPDMTREVIRNATWDQVPVPAPTTEDRIRHAINTDADGVIKFYKQLTSMLFTPEVTCENPTPEMVLELCNPTSK